jgi:hypothetical protein
VTVLNPMALTRSTAATETAALLVDPLIFGNVRETFAKFISNGETVVTVRAVTGEAAEFAAETLSQYSPIAIELVPLSAGSEFVHPSTEPNRNARER